MDKDKKQIKSICLDLDDWYPYSGGLNEMLEIKKHYPGFKITLFTIPFPASFTMKGGVAKSFNMGKYKDWAKLMNSFDWIQIAVHGTMHIKGEYNCDRKRAKLLLKAAENVFKQAGMKYEKIFKAPYWQLSQEALDVLYEKGYAVALNPEQPLKLKIPKDMKVYVFNHNIKDIFPNKEHLKSHGHVLTYNNAFKDRLGLICSLPTNVEFKFVSQCLEKIS